MSYNYAYQKRYIYKLCEKCGHSSHIHTARIRYRFYGLFNSSHSYYVVKICAYDENWKDDLYHQHELKSLQPLKPLFPQKGYTCNFIHENGDKCNCNIEINKDKKGV